MGTLHKQNVFEARKRGAALIAGNMARTLERLDLQQSSKLLGKVERRRGSVGEGEKEREREREKSGRYERTKRRKKKKKRRREILKKESQLLFPSLLLARRRA